jgi:2-dehydro-3-deoxyphosphooctonate aldolase (KDO 8-P synthase)
MDRLLYEQLNRNEKFFLIAGPCVIEDRELMLRTADFLVKLTSELGITFIFKTSFVKANRTSGNSYKGPGLEEGLSLFNEIKQQFNLPILTDVHETIEVDSVAEVCDILQIPAFLSRQTALIQAAARTGRIVNIKKGQFMAPEDMQSTAQKVLAIGNEKVILTERGTSFGYHDLVVDFRSFPILKQYGFPVVYDVTHSLQKPSKSTVSGGTPEYAAMMAQAAIATGFVNGLFIETHPEPSKALSDASSMLPLSEIKPILQKCLNIKSILNIQHD